MSVRIARLRNGEDVISDVQAVFTKTDEEQQTPVGWQFNLPYTIQVLAITAEESYKKITKISEPELYFQPWMPLSAQPSVIIRFDEVVAVYDPHEAVMKKYNELTEAQNGQRENSSSEERQSE